jgi:hypothetical protein
MKKIPEGVSIDLNVVTPRAGVFYADTDGRIEFSTVDPFTGGARTAIGSSGNEPDPKWAGGRSANPVDDVLAFVNSFKPSDAEKAKREVADRAGFIARGSMYYSSPLPLSVSTRLPAEHAIEPGIAVGRLHIRITRIEVAKLPVPAKAREYGGCGVDQIVEHTLNVYAQVPHRDTGEYVEIRLSEVWCESWSKERKAAQVRTVLRAMMEHEVDEMIEVDGRRLWDPHAGIHRD